MPVKRKQCYTIPILSRLYDYADAETVDVIGFCAEAGSSSSKTYFAKAGIITEVVLIGHCETTNGTAEAWPWYLRLNGTTDYALGSVSASAAIRDFSKRGLSIPVTTTDYAFIKTICPTWATNPVGTWVNGYIVVSY